VTLDLGPVSTRSRLAREMHDFALLAGPRRAADEMKLRYVKNWGRKFSFFFVGRVN
jgi:hypothetical protein